MYACTNRKRWNRNVDCKRKYVKKAAPTTKIFEKRVDSKLCSSIRGRIGEVVSAGKLKTPAIIRSHGGRARAIEAEEVHIDIAFLAAASSDEWGNAKGTGGKNNFGSIGFGIGDSRYVDNTVIITDIVVDFPNLPAPISTIDVDCVCLVDEIGNPKKNSFKRSKIYRYSKRINDDRKSC
ncbi:citrate lyase subunit alpha [Fusobacterium polymorphum]|uniref:citrate lyase subunit alpha n=1 Tax=Fusobacterium nucleatum subsp. polymorphum TaxID=76857 RepID=UPI0030B9730D